MNHSYTSGLAMQQDNRHAGTKGVGSNLVIRCVGGAKFANTKNFYDDTWSLESVEIMKREGTKRSSSLLRVKMTKKILLNLPLKEPNCKAVTV